MNKEERKILSEFAKAPVRVEGAPIDPDEFTWECDLDKCKKCRDKYDRMRARYMDWLKEEKK